MATSSIFNAIVPEALTDDNYPNWSSCVQDYLLGQDLWDIIVETESKPTKNKATWRKRNAMALHAIKISCRPDMLSHIRKINSAKDAWESLAKMHKTPKVYDPTRRLGDPETETNVDYARYSPLLKAVATGDWNATKEFFERHRNEYVLEATVSSDGTTVLHHAVIKGQVKIVRELVQLMSEEGLKKRDNRGRTALHYAAELRGMTVLHHAVIKGHVKIVEELVQLMSKEDLKIRDNRGRTALHCAVTCGFDKMVACMVQKEAELVSIADKKGVIPVVLACQSGNKDVTRYLYPRTPLEDLTSQNGINGATLLCYCITNNMFDIPSELLRKCPRLAFDSDAKENTLIYLLSQMPSAFYGGTLLWELRITSFIYWCIYSCIPVPSNMSSTPPSNDTRNDIPKQNQLQTKQGCIITQGIRMPSNVSSTPPSNDTRIDIPKQYQRQTNQGSIITQAIVLSVYLWGLRIAGVSYD